MEIWNGSQSRLSIQAELDTLNLIFILLSDLWGNPSYIGHMVRLGKCKLYVPHMR